VSETFFERPILNSPYDAPKLHHALDADGQPLDVPPVEGRRRSELITPVPKPGKQKAKPEQGKLVFGDEVGLTTSEQGYNAALTRRAVHQLQRIKPSGVYGDDYRHKTLWDEYCHEVQEGPYDLLDDAWDRTLRPVLRTIVDAIPRHEAALLTIGAIWELDEGDEPALGIFPDLIQRNLQQMLSKIAGARDMSRFDPTLF
jgi:hypothetical protein